jgi:non-heme chloroperoxidase
MSFIKSKADAFGNAVQLFYEDLGTGKPVVFIHGWPLNHEMWEYQLAELPKHGLRCIAYDRRGFGKSDRPWADYDYDTLADDLKAVLEQLDLRDVTLVGFSMGGGEIARYIGKYGTQRVAKVVLMSAVTPFMLKTDDNTEGVPKENFDEMVEKITKDRPAFMSTFGKQFYGSTLLSHPVSQQFLDWNQSHCMMSSAKATVDCVRSFSETDFRNDLEKINVPTLIIHGDADKTVPIEVSGDKTAALLPHAKYTIYEGAPHGLFITEKDKLNADLLEFIGGTRMPSKGKKLEHAAMYS